MHLHHEDPRRALWGVALILCALAIVATAALSTAAIAAPAAAGEPRPPSARDAVAEANR